MLKCCATKKRRPKPTKLFTMPEKNNQELLKELQKLKQENETLKASDETTVSHRELIEKMRSFEWILKQKHTAKKSYAPDYGDLSLLNKDGLIKKSINKEQLQDIVSEYLDLLETSAAVYEKNGDYALGIFSSGWCQMMDAASRRLCNTDDNRKALASGKWLCHDSCWKDTSLKAMNEGKPKEVACNGGLHLYAVPVWANKQIIGAINFGFGSPPKDDSALKKLSEKFKIPLQELRERSMAYKDRPQFIIDYAKQRIQNSAKHLGYLVERKIAEDRLLEIKERYRTTLHSIGDGVITTDKDGRITNMNAAAEGYCGWAFTDAAGKPLSEVFWIINAKTRKAVDDPVKKVLKSKKVIGLANHTVLISKNGKEYQIADSAAPIKNRDGEITGVVLVFSDVTEKYKTEEKLRESEERLDMAMMVKNDGMWDWDLITNETFFDERYYTMAGYKPNEFPKTFAGWARKVHPEDLQTAQDAIRAYLNGASDIYDIEFRFRRKDGQWMWINGKGKIIERNAEGKPIRMIGTHTDITERKQAEEALRKSEEQHRRLFETISQGVIYQAVDGHIISANPSAEKMLGLSLDQMRGKTSMDSRWKMITENGEKVHGSDHPSMIALRTGEKIGPVTRGIYIPEKDEYAWLSITATPLFRPGEEKPFQSYAVFDDITFRKQHEVEIKKQQQLIHTILNKLPIGIAINTVESEPKVELVNENFAQIYGVRTDDLPTVESFWEAVYEDEAFREEIKNRTLSDIKSGDPKRMQWQDIPITKNGKIFKYISAHNILLEEQGIIISTVMDTTERKLAEQALKASETKFRSLFEEANDAILIMEEDVFVECNSKAEDVYGCKKELIIGKTPLDFSPELQSDGGASGILALEKIRATMTGDNQFFEWQHQRFDGSLFDAEISLSAFRINGKTLIQAIVRDVTERKETEKTKQVLFQIANEILHNLKMEDFIEAVEKQLSQLVDTTNFYIALYDSESGMLSAPFEKDQKDSIESWPAKGSATGLVIEGKQPLLLTKHDVLGLIERGEIIQTGSICESWLGVPLFQGTDVSGVIVVQSYHNPEAFDSNTMEVFEYVSNQVSMALERTRNFEDLLKAKNKAEESNRLKSAFLANMSHEIRTPMNGIMGFAELLKDPRLSDDQQQKYIEIIEKSSERMLNIINDIVDISRIEAGVMEVYLTESDINEQLDYIYTFFRPQVEAKGMQLNLSKALPAGQEKTTTDREKLFAVLTNLVKNAIKYSNEGTIELGCNKKGSSLEFFVRDTGIGIPKDRQHAIFERFVQADIEDIEARQGAGLGLAISRAYVEMLGGELWVESEEGRGSAFYFTLPYNAESATETIERQLAPSEKSDDIRKLKILMVEDDEVSEMLLNETVKLLGKEILKARTGVEAVEVCRANPDIDLILMDIRMSDMGGYEATQQIREFNKEVIIIAQTAYAQSGDRERLIDAGCNDYLPKPIKKEKLLGLISKYVG